MGVVRRLARYADSTVASENSLTLPAKPVAGPKRYRDAMEAPVRKLTVNLLATYKEINAVGCSAGEGGTCWA